MCVGATLLLNSYTGVYTRALNFQTQTIILIKKIIAGKILILSNVTSSSSLKNVSKMVQ